MNYNITTEYCVRGGFMYRRSEFKKRTYKTGEVADILHLHYQTVIKYDRAGILSFHRNEHDRRVMFREDLLNYLEEKQLLMDDEAGVKRDIIYCRVSSHEQQAKGDLDRQVVKVMEYAEPFHLQNPLILKEVGSGLNDNRKQIQKLIGMVLHGEVARIFISYRDRLTRFGYHYLETICKECGVEIHVINDEGSDKSAQEEMVEDMMALIAGFSGKLYGMRSKSKKEIKKQLEKIPTVPDEE